LALLPSVKLIVHACIEKIISVVLPLICRKVDSGRVKRKYVAGSQKRKEKKRKIKAPQYPSIQGTLLFQTLIFHKVM